MHLVIIADDLSGAADTGAPFASHGFATTIALVPEVIQNCDVLVLSTDSRDGDETTAVRANRDAVCQILSESIQPRWVYKKIDSALRGHPAAELRAVMQALGESRALVAPALPVEGRTTVHGRHHIDGIALEETTFGGPGVTSNLVDLFAADDGSGTVHLPLGTIRQGRAAISRVLRTIESGIIVADAETNSDLELLAQATVVSDLRLLSGSAGFARHLAAALSQEGAPPFRDQTPSGSGPILIVAGSRDGATATQVEHLRQMGTPVIALDQVHLDDGTASLDAIISTLAASLASGQSAVLTTVGLGHSVQGPAFVVDRLADIVSNGAVLEQIGGLVMTGGDVAAGLLRRLGANALHLGGEIRPALPWGVATLSDGSLLPVATKAGSFGAEDALQACLDHLIALGSGE